MKTELTILCRQKGFRKKYFSIAIEPLDGGFVVPFLLRRQGKPDLSGTKTPQGAISYEKAKRAYESAIWHRLADGYRVENLERMIEICCDERIGVEAVDRQPPVGSGLATK